MHRFLDEGGGRSAERDRHDESDPVQAPRETAQRSRRRKRPAIPSRAPTTSPIAAINRNRVSLTLAPSRVVTYFRIFGWDAQNRASVGSAMSSVSVSRTTARRDVARSGRGTGTGAFQIPVKSGLPSGPRGAGAAGSGLPSCVRAMPEVGRSSHWAPAGIVPTIRMMAANNRLLSPLRFRRGTLPLERGMVTLRAFYTASKF